MKIDVPGDHLAATFQALIAIIKNSARRGDKSAVQTLFKLPPPRPHRLKSFQRRRIAGSLICELARRTPDWPMLVTPKTFREKSDENLRAKALLDSLGVGTQSTPPTARNISLASHWSMRAVEILTIVERFRSFDPSTPQSESPHIARLILKATEEAQTLAKRRGRNPFARKMRQPGNTDPPDLRMMRAHPPDETLPAPNSSAIGRRWWQRVYLPILFAIWAHEPEKLEADTRSVTARNRPHDHIRRALVSRPKTAGSSLVRDQIYSHFFPKK